MSAIRHYTAGDLDTMPDDGNRYELVHGELLVTPAPGGLHQIIISRLHGELFTYLKPHRLTDQAAMAPLDIYFGDDTVVEPDLLVADTRTFLRSRSSRDITQLHLAIEIISPSSARNDRGVKRQVYQSSGVAEYWVVDADAEQVEVWTPNATEPRVERGLLSWRHPAIDVACQIDLGRLFDFT